MDENEIQKLSLIEQNLSAIMSQKQNLQKSVLEIENALEELKTKDSAYQISGPVMIKKDSKILINSLNDKKEITTKRLELIIKQEKILRDQMNEIQKKLLKK